MCIEWRFDHSVVVWSTLLSSLLNPIQTEILFMLSVTGGRSLYNFKSRADQGGAVKRARSSKKVWCSGLGLCLEMSLVFDFGQGLRCGLSIRHCRCHWIMAAWFVFLYFFLVPLSCYAVSEGQMLLFFAGGLVGVDKHPFQRVAIITSMTPGHWIIFSFYYSPMSLLFQNKNN